ncbi:peptidylprolyl isomerase [Candidatus Peribacteria bacterium]|nr:peptidylprolyl isomerase [Candidatus Peribacteria bacterium]
MNNLYKFIIPLFALAFLLVSCGKQQAPPPPASPSAVTVPQKILDARTSFDGTILSGKHTVVLHTNKGDITVELDADAAPKTVTNFIALAKAGAYDDLVFHRVIPNFMVQGGDPEGNGTGGESIFGPNFEDEINANSYGLDKKKLKDEAQGETLPPNLEKATIKEFYEQQGYKYNDVLKSLPMKKGALAMANRGPNTNGSQFFIVQAEEVPWLDGRHTVFGKVTEGIDVVDAIANVQRDANDKPVSPVTYTVEVKN